MEKERFIDFGAGAEDHDRADFSGRERDRVYVSRGGKGFADVSYLSGADSVEDGRGFARADLDRDGYEDAVVINRNAPLFRLFLNRAGPAQGNAFVSVELAGAPKAGVGAAARSTAEATGARIIARCGGRSFTTEHVLGSGMGVINSRVLPLGLGSCEKLDSLEVRFPSGATVRGTNLAVRRRYRAVEGKALEEVPGIYGPRQPAAAAAAVPVAKAGEALLAALGPQEKELVVVELWATWCDACKRLRPRLDRLGSRFAGKVAVVGASMEPRDDAAAVERYVTELRPAHSLRPYSAAAVAAAKEILGGDIAATPSVIVLDARSGKVELAGPGIPSESDLERILWARSR